MALSLIAEDMMERADLSQANFSPFKDFVPINLIFNVGKAAPFFLIKVRNTRNCRWERLQRGRFNNVAAATGMQWTGTFRFTFQNM